MGDNLIISGDWNDDMVATQWTCFWTELGLYEPAKKGGWDQSLLTIEEFYKCTIYMSHHCYDSFNLKYFQLLKGCAELTIKLYSSIFQDKPWVLANYLSKNTGASI